MRPMPDAERPVPLGDLEVAQRVAAGARGGGRAEREPTLTQLLAAFGEPAPTPEARRRVRAALHMAGVSVLPDLADADPGERVRLLTTAAPSGGSAPLKAAAATVGLLAIIAAVAVVSSLGGGDDPGDKTVGRALPATTTAPVATTPPAVTTAPPTVATAPPPAATVPTTTTPTATTQTTTTQTPTDAEVAAAERTRRRRADARRAAAARRARARKPITVRLTAPVATYLCADSGPGSAPLFAGTLVGRKTFRGRRVRLNIGLASTRVTVNGRNVALNGSPAGLDLTRRIKTPLGSGQRPQC